jgi:hypothetical protein
MGRAGEVKRARMGWTAVPLLTEEGEKEGGLQLDQKSMRAACIYERREEVRGAS